MVVVAGDPRGRACASTHVQGTHAEGGCCTGPAMCTQQQVGDYYAPRLNGYLIGPGGRFG